MTRIATPLPLPLTLATLVNPEGVTDDGVMSPPDPFAITQMSPSCALDGIVMLLVMVALESTKVKFLICEENKLCIIDISSYSCSRNGKYIT